MTGEKIRETVRETVSEYLRERIIKDSLDNRYILANGHCFGDLVDGLVKKLTIPVVNKRRELLIATIHGWQDYKDQGISIEDYIDEIESNL